MWVTPGAGPSDRVHLGTPGAGPSDKECIWVPRGRGRVIKSAFGYPGGVATTHLVY